MFKEYMNKNIASKMQFSNYKGIRKKDFPRWMGWAIIEKYKEEGVHVSDIQDKTLDILVHNFFFIAYLTESLDY